MSARRGARICCTLDCRTLFARVLAAGGPAICTESWTCCLQLIHGPTFIVTMVLRAAGLDRQLFSYGSIGLSPESPERPAADPTSLPRLHHTANRGYRSGETSVGA